MEAATQIFYSLSLSFGGLVAMASYNPVKNNCKKDAILISLINCGTSVFASIVVFSVLGFKVNILPGVYFGGRLLYPFDASHEEDYLNTCCAA